VCDPVHDFARRGRDALLIWLHFSDLQPCRGEVKYNVLPEHDQAADAGRPAAVDGSLGNRYPTSRP